MLALRHFLLGLLLLKPSVYSLVFRISSCSYGLCWVPHESPYVALVFQGSGFNCALRTSVKVGWGEPQKRRAQLSGRIVAELSPCTKGLVGSVLGTQWRKGKVLPWEEARQ